MNMSNEEAVAYPIDHSQFTIDNSRFTHQFPDLCQMMVVVFGYKKDMIDQSHWRLQSWMEGC